MRRTASTASAMTRAFWTLAMGPGDFTCGRTGPHRTEAGVDRLPVQRVKPSRDVVGSLVLVLEVVSVLPHVDAQDLSQLVHVGAVVVGISLDRVLARPG